MKKTIKKLVNDLDTSVSLKAISAVVGLILVVVIVAHSLITGKNFDSAMFIGLLGFITACLGLGSLFQPQPQQASNPEAGSREQ